jgi:hypothetical protein
LILKPDEIADIPTLAALEAKRMTVLRCVAQMKPGASLYEIATTVFKAICAPEIP